MRRLRQVFRDRKRCGSVMSAAFRSVVRPYYALPVAKRIAVCIGCGCDDNHACPFGCSWLRVDYDDRKGVCSECVDHCEAWDQGDRTPRAQSVAEIEAERQADLLAGRTLKPELPRPQEDGPCPHDWPYPQVEMGDACRWCFMTFARHVHTECP